MSDDLSGFSLIELFRSEAETQTALLSTGLLAMEGGGPFSPSAVEPLMRAAHSLKGAARIVGLDPAVHVAHVMEDCFVAVQEGRRVLRPRHIDTLLRGVDFLNQVSQLSEAEIASWSERNAAVVDALVAEIAAILTDKDDPPSEDPAPASEADAPTSPALIELATDVPTSSTPSRPRKSEDLSGFSLVDLFRSEAETNTAILSEGLLALEGGKSVNPLSVEPLMRAAHSLKGAARIVNLDPAVRVAHVMEDCFVAVQDGKLVLQTRDVDVLLRGVDMLSRVAQLGEGEVWEWSEKNAAVIDGLVADVTAIQTGDRTPRQEPPPAPALSKNEPPSPTPQPSNTASPTVSASSDSPTAPATPAAEQSKTATAATSADAQDRVVRVTAESLTRLMSLAGESLVQSQQLRPFVDSLQSIRAQLSGLLTTVQSMQDRHSSATSVLEQELFGRARSQANACVEALNGRMEEFEDFSRRGEDLAGRLHHEVLTSRMRPLADGVRGFPRMVRDVSRTLGKKVNFEVVGETTGVDRDILEKLEAPLNHLIRNGLDHAIEPPEERLAAGKPETGRIRIEARHRAGMLQITLSDDGRGIGPPRLRAKIVERGLASHVMAGQMSESELLEFLFLPGFSTKEAVTEISGRGVGLDVVQNMVRAVGGVVRVSSQVGVGTRFTLQLPISMSVIRALLVRVGGEPYAFPLNRIDRILTLETDSLQLLEGRQHFMMDGQPVALVEACQVLELPPAVRTSEELAVVVASDRSHRFGVVVDAFLGERDLEVRPLDPRLGKVPNLNSASVLEDGWPVLIIDVEDLVRSVDNMLSGRRIRKVTGATEAQVVRGPRRVLVVDDSLTVRELERQLLESHGYSVDVAVDGVDGWNAVRSGEYDLIISDVDMPRMGGIEFVTRVKQDPGLRSIPVVIVSYKEREEDRMRGLDAGANAYLTKSSFHDRTFLSTVVDLIGEANS